MSVHSNGETIDSVLARVRAEQALATDASRQALLRHECGVLEEARGDETAAAREFLAAFNADPALREPLEALLRIYGRSRSERHLPKLLQSLVGAARSPAESARALWELGSYREDVEHDWAAAKLCLLEAVELDPSEVACWLGLGLGAAAQGEADLQARALQARAALADEPTWRGLLLVELGEKCAAGGEHARAMELFEQAAALGGSARLGARASQEIAAERAGELDLVLRALEGQAELIELGLEDPAAAVRLGVPRHMHSAVHAAAAWLRVALVRQRLGDPGGSSIALGAAADRLPDNLLLARLRIAACDAAGDGAQAAAIAKGQLAAGAQGGDAAALWVRVGQAAQAAGDENAALEAYGKAAQLDPQSVVARVLETDLLARGDDPARFAAALQAELEVPLPAAGRGRAWLAVACVWALRAQDGARAREALGRAVESGVPELRAQRVARLCAAQCRDEAWHEQATARLCELSASASERAGLWLDLGLSRLRRGQAEAAQAAFGELADVAAQGELPGGLSPWLGHALAAYAVGLGWGGLAQRGSEHVSRLAKVQPGEALARGMALVAALLAARAGEREQALRRLEEEHRRDPADPVAALFLADSQRRGGDAPAAAETLLSCSRASHDPELCGTMQIEAAFLLWRAGDRDAAIAALELAIEHTPVAARVALLWALRAGRPNDQASRRRVLELDEMAGPCAGPLERFGLAAAARDGEAEARGALAELEHAQAGGDVAVAAALGQLLFAGDVDDRHVMARACGGLGRRRRGRSGGRVPGGGGVGCAGRFHGVHGH
ncbi:MAG: hypothetical protein HY744_30495, partial [Deltaproteobacteria bacterium]|nr:hypothetical protein [Deltaproteobacteria bacterium]